MGRDLPPQLHPLEASQEAHDERQDAEEQQADGPNEAGTHLAAHLRQAIHDLPHLGDPGIAVPRGIHHNRHGRKCGRNTWKAEKKLQIERLTSRLILKFLKSLKISNE